MDEIPDNSIHLMVTSPPYNVGKEYESELSLEDYKRLLTNVLSEVYRVLTEGGRACINIANTDRTPYIPLHSYIIQIMSDIGFHMRGEIIWDKGASVGASTAWGSWKSASNPVLRDIHEYILVFSKGTFGRPKGVDTLSGEEFLEYTKSIWKFSTVNAKSIGHPAPFPIELPWRLIQLYSFEGDIVLDPFMGSGQTAIAALRAGRKFIGYDNKTDYVELTNKRLDQVSNDIFCI